MYLEDMYYYLNVEPPAPRPVSDDVATWSTEQKLGRALDYGVAGLGPEVVEQIKEIFNWKVLGAIALVYGVGWYFGVSQIITGVMVIPLCFGSGWTVATANLEIVQFVQKAQAAKSHAELQLAGQHIARATATGGVLALVSCVAGILSAVLKGARLISALKVRLNHLEDTLESVRQVEKELRAAKKNPAPSSPWRPSATGWRPHREGVGYELKPMEPEWHGRDWFSGVRRVPPQRLPWFRLTAKDGRLYDATGALFDTTPTAKNYYNWRAIYVMAEDGSIYASMSQKVGVFHHSTFLHGRPVAAAGEICVEEGVVTMIGRRSGHYRGAALTMQQFIYQLKQVLGVDLSKAKIVGPRG